MLASLSRRRHIPFPAGQCSGTPSTRNSCFTFSRDTGFHTTMVMATEQPWYESSGLSRVGCTAAASVSHTHSWHQSLQDVWLKSGRSLTRRSLTRRSASGVYVWGHAFNKKDTLSIGCETVDKTVKWPLTTCNVNLKFSAMHFRC